MSDATLQHEPLVSAVPPRPRRRKLAAVSLVLLLLLLSSPVFYRQWRLSGVPDIGVPFPVADVLTPIPEQDNALPLFEDAYALLVQADHAERSALRQQQSDGWEPGHELLNKYLELNRPALEKWREATERNDHQFVPVDRIVDTFGMVTHVGPTRDLIRWCHTEVERLTRIGRPAEALPWLRASFRCSSLVTRNSGWIDRSVGAAFLSFSVTAAETWMQDPRVTEGDLRQLLAITRESAALVEKLSRTVKVECLGFQALLPHMVESRWHAWLHGEPEFSRRLVAHATANHLPFVDAPRRERPSMLEGEFFDEAAVGVRPEGRLPPHELVKQLERSKLISSLPIRLEPVHRTEARYACLQVALAAQAHHRRHGEFPARLAELQPDYLAELPDDPYSPRPAPVLYRRTGDGAVVYSRYRNGIDDGGTIVTYREAGGRVPIDFGIRLRRPAHPPVVAPRP